MKDSKFKIERHPEATAEGSSQLKICEDSSLRLPARSRFGEGGLRMTY